MILTAPESRVAELVAYGARKRASLPWLDQLRDCEHGPEQNAEPANDNVCNAKERVPAAHDGVGGQEQ